jgi:triosephosphate isomerase
MQPASRALAVTLGKGLKKKLLHERGAEIVVAPPFVYIDAIGTLLGGSNALALGAQDASPYAPGPHTSQISLAMLQDLEVQYVILGHSERRALGEDDAMVNEKLRAAVKEGFTGVVCVGEHTRDAGGHYLSLIEEQLRRALLGISKAKLDRVVIAYEPLWAIGTGMNATPADVHEIKIFIERILSDTYGRTYARRVRILYGGSVNSKNARELFSDGAVDGFLVGGASLKAEEFIGIIDALR